MNKSPYCRHLWYSLNILQWNKNNIKSTKMNTGDYLINLSSFLTVSLIVLMLYIIVSLLILNCVFDRS